MRDPVRPPDEYEAEKFLRSPKTRRMLKKLGPQEPELESLQEVEYHPLYRQALRVGTSTHRVARLYRPRRRKRDPNPDEAEHSCV